MQNYLGKEIFNIYIFITEANYWVQLGGRRKGRGDECSICKKPATQSKDERV